MEDVSQQRAALLVTTLSSLLTPMMASAVIIAMPAIAKDFAMDAVQLGWVASAYFLVAAVFLLPFGRLADIVGRKKIFSFSALCGAGVFFSLARGRMR